MCPPLLFEFEPHAAVSVLPSLDLIGKFTDDNGYLRFSTTTLPAAFT